MRFFKVFARPAGHVALALALALPFAGAEPYRVRAGDTLSGLALARNVSVRALLDLNPQLRSPNSLVAGAMLTLPARRAPRAAPASSPQTVTLRGGETLWLVAARHHLSVAQLLAANPQVRRANFVQAGQTLRLPVAVPSSSNAASNATAGKTGSNAVPVVRTASTRGALSALSGWLWPLAGVITSGFGWRSLEVHGEHLHLGVDIAAPLGSVVRASRAGQVREARFDGAAGWGWTVVVDHGGGYSTRYSHASALLVKVGDRVTRGQPVARVGSTGNSTGPHLDYRVYKNGVPLDPEKLR